MRFFLLGFMLLGLASCTQAVNSESNFAKNSQNLTASSYNHNLIIFYDAQVGEKALLKAVKAYNAELIYHYKQLNGIAIRVPEDKKLEDAIRYFEKVEGVLVVNQDQVNQLH